MPSPISEFILPSRHDYADVLVGDCIEILRTLPDKKYRSCVTSPPYFGLRDYGNESQIGREPTPDEFVSKLVDVFREVRRVLTNDGTCWINIGDTYASSPPGNARGVSEKSGLAGAKSETYRKRLMQGHATKMDTSRIPGIPKKSLLLIPFRLAIALQQDGWVVRQAVIWENPGGCESVKDRPSLSHEYVFMLAKDRKYLFNREAVLEPSGANCRSVWKISTTPFKGAHFATMPPALVQKCLLASAQEGDHVLDPFGGAGTTGLVARRLGMRSTLIELNPDYAEIARKRIEAG